MKYDFIIFGGTGLQGRICAKDLLQSGYSILLVGRDPTGIQHLLKNKKAGFLKVDLKNESSISQAIMKSKAKVVINCAELTFNIPIMNACLKTKTSLTDLGGLQKITKQQFSLDNQFKNKNILCITGCGSTPGISNVLTAHIIEDFDSVDTIDLGFAWDSNKKVFVTPYSIQSIFDEFTQPPVVLSDGKFFKSNRIKCQGTFNFKAVGKQTCYCIVHSEVYTFAKYFKSKGIKNVHYLAGFPKHSYDYIQNLIKQGYNSSKPTTINGINTTPLYYITQELKKIHPPKGYKEVENIWVRISGKKNDKPLKAEIDCIVKTEKGWESAGSNIDTGRTISIISQMLFKGEIKSSGVHAQEGCVPHNKFISELGKRHIKVYLNKKPIN